MLASTALADSGWSWASEEKIKKAPAAEQGRAIFAEVPHETQHVQQTSVSDFNQPQPQPLSLDSGTGFTLPQPQPLPLEPHSPLPQEDTVPRHVIHSTALDSENFDANREARFLGLSDTLCSWGVGVTVSSNTKANMISNRMPPY